MLSGSSSPPFRYPSLGKLGHMSIRWLYSMMLSRTRVWSCSLLGWWLGRSPSLLRGRRVQLAQGKIVSLHHAFNREEDLSGKITIVHPAIGLIPRRVRRSERPDCPPLVTRLLQMWNAGLARQDESIGPTLDALQPCALCGMAQDKDGLSGHACSLCLKFWHGSCAASMSCWVRGKTPCIIPDVLKQGLCSLCRDATSNED